MRVCAAHVVLVVILEVQTHLTRPFGPLVKAHGARAVGVDACKLGVRVGDPQRGSAIGRAPCLNHRDGGAELVRHRREQGAHE